MFFGTASKIAWRELRSAPGKFVFVIMAVAIGVAALSGVKGFGYAFRGMLLRNAKQLIAADLQAQVFQNPTPEETEKMATLGAKYGTLTDAIETVSMAGSSTQRVPQMVSVKAIDPNCYPFYGKLKTSPAVPLTTLLKDDSSVVVTPELLMRMKVAQGGTIRIGGQEFRIAGTLLTEPDRLASGFGPGMRVLMSRECA